MSSAASQFKRLLRRDGDLCHYCKCPMVKGMPGNRIKRAMTRDHVIPKSLGGPNSVNNYVLACRGCNEKRGNTMAVCGCQFCYPIYQRYYDTKFDQLMSHAKPKIIKAGGMWRVFVDGKKTKFETFEEAIAFATDDSLEGVN